MKKFSKYIVTNEQENAVIDLLAGKKTTREVGKILECSHENSRLMAYYLIRQWYLEGKVVITLK